MERTLVSGLVAVAVSVVALVAMPVLGATAAQRRSASCAVRGARTIVLTTSGRISFREPEYASDGALYGCLNRRRRVVTLTGLTFSQISTEQVAFVRLRGVYASFVVYGSYSAGGSRRCWVDVHRVDLLRTRRRRVMVAESVAQRSSDPYPPCPVVTDLIASPTGATAWIVGGTLQRLEGNGGRTLDTGVEPGSLALSESGRTLYWTKDGSAHSAPSA